MKNEEQKSVQTDEHSKDGIKGNPEGIRDKPDADSTLTKLVGKDGAVIGDNDATNEKEKSNKTKESTKKLIKKKTKK